jgi:hypothetical protein
MRNTNFNKLKIEVFRTTTKIQKTMKFLIGFITAMLITCVVSAQHGNSPGGFVNLGIKGGINLYNIHYDTNANYDPLTGYHFGLLGHIHLNSKWALQPELVYSRQGTKNGDSDYTLDYINIPVLIQYMFDNGFRLQAGPQLGFLVRADNKDNLNPIDFGVGLGVSYVVPSTGFGIDARYNIGLSDINNDDAVVSTNRGLQLGLFYIFAH